MSHFTVLVIGAENEQQVEEMLHPFWELDLNREYIAKDPRAVFQKKFATSPTNAIIPTIPYVEDAYREFLEDEKNVKFLNKHNLQYSSAKEWAEECHGCYLNKEAQYYGYYHNPNAKWDWFSIGGRWTGYFKLKEGAIGGLGTPGVFGNSPKDGYADFVEKGDIDWEGMRKDALADAKKWWEEAEGKDKSDRYFKYGIRKEDTEESYLKRQSSTATFAVVKDGKWYEKGKMGWWAITSEEKEDGMWEEEFDKLISDIPDTTPLALVDCHI